MSQSVLDEKKIFLIATGEDKNLKRYSKIAGAAFPGSVIYTANDGFEALFKLENAPPQVLLVDLEVPKLDAIKLTTEVFLRQPNIQTSVVIVSPIPDQEHFVDKVLSGQVQFLS